MTKERLKSPRARLFVALDLPEEIREGIVAWGRRELGDPVLRVVRPESLHVTLAFLGYLPEKEIGRISEIVEGLRSPAPEIQLHDPVGRPSGRHPRLFALPVDSPDLDALQTELEEKLVAARLYKPGKRPFWPHVTVARVKPEGRARSGGSDGPRAGSRKTSCNRRGPSGRVSTVLNSSRRVRSTARWRKSS